MDLNFEGQIIVGKREGELRVEQEFTTIITSDTSTGNSNELIIELGDTCNSRSRFLEAVNVHTRPSGQLEILNAGLRDSLIGEYL